MSSIISGLDKQRALQVGENNHSELPYSGKLKEKIVQFFFQLVRCENHSILESVHEEILSVIWKNKKLYIEELEMMYKLIGQTRDIISGKGEQQLAFMQIWGFYKVGFKLLAAQILCHFVQNTSGDHPYGSWKDIKYFCEYINKKHGTYDHALINQACNIMLSQIENDYLLLQNKDPNRKLSLVGKWCPRGKGRFKEVHNIIARKMFWPFMVSAKSEESKRKALNKCRIHLTKQITALNKELNTTQIYQCGDQWSSINFNDVTASTLRRQGRAFANISIKGKERSEKEDRRRCAINLKTHFKKCKSGEEGINVHGRRLNVYELVKDVVTELNTGKNPGCSIEQSACDRINLQWEDNKKNNKGLGPFIPCSDVSYSMYDNNKIPLFSSIGLGIRASEMTHPVFANRILSFSDIPVWHVFKETDTFVDKVLKMTKTNSGMGTNFYRALKMILDVLVKNEVHPLEVENLILGIFSDMQIEESIKYCKETENYEIDYLDTMFDGITKMYADAGMKSKFKLPYNPPHILFWNLRNTTGFPVVSTQKNVTMLSGYSSTLLNSICDKGIDVLKDFTPQTILKDILNNKRYDILSYDIQQYKIHSLV